MTKILCGQKISNDGLIDQAQLKDHLVNLKSLLDDLNVVKTDSVKQAIATEVYKSIGVVEKTADKLYELYRQMDMVIVSLEKLIDSKNGHRTQEEIMWECYSNNKIRTQLEPVDKNSFEHQMERLIDENLASPAVGSDASLPKDEQDRYTQWLEGKTLDEAVKTDTTRALTMDEILNGIDATPVDEIADDEADQAETPEEVEAKFMNSCVQLEIDAAPAGKPAKASKAKAKKANAKKTVAKKTARKAK